MSCSWPLDMPWPLTSMAASHSAQQVLDSRAAAECAGQQRPLAMLLAGNVPSRHINLFSGPSVLGQRSKKNQLPEPSQALQV